MQYVPLLTRVTFEDLAAQVLILNSMQFYFTLILIHRPLIHMSAAQQAMANFDSGTADSTTVCTVAATNIAKLVRDYQQFYCLKRISSPAIHFTFIAATIHIVDFRLFKTERSKFLLQGCVSALSEMGESYPIGRKAVGILQDLMERWNPCNDSQRQDKSTAQSSSDSVLPGPVFKYGSVNGTENNGRSVGVNSFQYRLVWNNWLVARVWKKLTQIVGLPVLRNLNGTIQGILSNHLIGQSITRRLNCLLYLTLR
jgi:hypothetical protein